MRWNDNYGLEEILVGSLIDIEFLVYIFFLDYLDTLLERIHFCLSPHTKSLNYHLNTCLTHLPNGRLDMYF